MFKMKNRTSLFFTIIFLLLGLFCARQSFAAGGVVISQVQISGGKGSTEQDFVELFNPSDSVFNLKGSRLVKRAQDSLSDSAIKSWTKDAYIPAKSFYLWANSGYAGISAKPDVTTSATLAQDNGVALRKGDLNSNTVLDAISWGQANNGFRNVSALNPASGKALLRKDFYSPDSLFTIAASQPHNSTVNELTAAFEASVKAPPETFSRTSAYNKVAASTMGQKTIASPTPTLTPLETGSVEGTSTQQSLSQPEAKPAEAKAPENPTRNTGGVKGKGYLAVAAAGLALFAFLLWYAVRVNKA